MTLLDKLKIKGGYIPPLSLSLSLVCVCVCVCVCVSCVVLCFTTD